MEVSTGAIALGTLNSSSATIGTLDLEVGTNAV